MVQAPSDMFMVARKTVFSVLLSTKTKYPPCLKKLKSVYKTELAVAATGCQ